MRIGTEAGVWYSKKMERERIHGINIVKMHAIVTE